MKLLMKKAYKPNKTEKDNTSITKCSLHLINCTKIKTIVKKSNRHNSSLNIRQYPTIY